MIGWSLWITPTLAAPPGRADVVEELDVGLVVVLPLVGQVVLVVDRLDGADRLARTAVDALVGVDVERALTLVDAVDGAFVDAGAVLDIHAREGRSHTSRAQSSSLSEREPSATASAASVGPRDDDAHEDRRPRSSDTTAERSPRGTMTEPPGPSPENTSVATIMPRPVAERRPAVGGEQPHRDEERGAADEREHEPEREPADREGVRDRAGDDRRRRPRRGR